MKSVSQACCFPEHENTQDCFLCCQNDMIQPHDLLQLVRMVMDFIQADTWKPGVAVKRTSWKHLNSGMYDDEDKTGLDT